jgi:hypothetical protein
MPCAIESADTPVEEILAEEGAGGGSSANRRKCIFLGIKLELAESPV